MDRKRWTSKRHKAVFAVLRVIFGAHTKIKYKYKGVKSLLKPPFLLMSNHVTTFDPIFASLSFKCPIYFCATDDIFNIPVASGLLKHLVAPIPISKSSLDMQAIRDCLRVLREGGAVGIFPEGNRTLTGAQWEMTDSVAKFVKLSKVPLVLYNIEGGYGSDPRWGVSKRKGKMRGYVKLVLQPDEYKDMPNSELFKLICNNLSVYDVTSGERFSSKRRAENIERVLYMCPNCGSISTIKSHKSHFNCECCNKQWQFGENLHIQGDDKFNEILEWYDWEKKRLIDAVRNDGVILCDENIRLFESIRFKRKRKLDGNKVKTDVNGITVFSSKNSKTFCWRDIDGLAIVQRDRVDFYYEGKTYQIRGDNRFCSLKYLDLYKGVK